MPLSPGEKLGPYEILAPIGKGGMGEVFRAVDTRLGRPVAIKTSRDQFNARFEREARAISSLNHDVGPNYLVLELVEGETLAARLKKSALPIKLVLQYGVQIADALAAAHALGIIHRDLKPANIMLTKSGVKVLDFGLARMKTSSEETLTASHVVMGTPAYMAPEQRGGKECDARSDIHSFGLVLYEMVTGERAFEATELRTLQPLPLERMVKTCLAQDPDERWQTARDLKRELEWTASGPDGKTTTASSGSRLAWAWITAGMLAVATAVLGVMLSASWRPAPERPMLMRFQIAPPPGVKPGILFSLSPDGTKLAYNASGPDGVSRLWVRAMDTVETRALEGTERLFYFFWSHDSRFIVFAADGKLKKADVAGGPPQTICAAASVYGGSWNHEGVIVFGINNATGIQRVSSAGGAPSPVTALNVARKDAAHLFPVFLPDGRHFLYLVLSAATENTGIYLGSLDSKPDHQKPKRLVATGFGAGFVPSPKGNGGAILFQQDGTLLVQRFDVGRMETTGEAVPVAEQLGGNPPIGYFAASDNGTLAYRGVAVSGDAQLRWFDRQGKNLGVVGAPQNYVGGSAISLSPDGMQVATIRMDGSNMDIWLTSFSRGGETRLTFDPAKDMDPVWSPDGNRIAFTSDRTGFFHLYQHASNGAGQDELLFESDHHQRVSDWSRDGRFLLYTDLDPKTKGDVWVLPMGGAPGSSNPTPFLRTEFEEGGGKFSPDGHWVAYYSDESGRFEIYVRPFPTPEVGGGKWMISQGGGSQSHWRDDGKELFYLAPDLNLMAVPVSTSGVQSQQAFQSGTPTALFKIPSNTLSWDVTADGKRVLLVVRTDDSASEPYTIVQNWMLLLKK